MRILFDPDFDAGAWPGPRGDRAAIAGDAWLGRETFLLRLETNLGLSAPHPSAADRAAALVPRLFREDRFYGASARIDPWATANRLLAFRDHLWEHGWRGESAGERRLGELAEVTLGLPPGRAERLENVAGWLEARRPELEEVGLLAARATLSPVWQRVLAALEARGTKVIERRLVDAPARGNLAAVRAPGAVLAPDDTSVQLVRPHGPREAARALAAALAADPRFEETLVIGADGILDEALAEVGLPVLGAASPHDGGALAELVPLTVQLAWAPLDPQLALDWLTLPDPPVPIGLARRLARTLGAWPSVGNPEWQRVVEEDLARMPEDGAKEARGMLDAVMTPVAPRSGKLTVRALGPRLDRLERWSAARAVTSPAHAQVLRQVRALRGRFQRAELTRLTPPRLDAVLASVAGDTSAPRRPGLAGFTGVGAPGSVAGPAIRVIWWGFLDTGSTRRGGVMLRGAEVRALATIGVRMPVVGAEMRDAAERARRPLRQTSGSLVLVAPHHDETGEPAHPHPLWDEIASHLADPRAARHLIRRGPVLAKEAARVQVPIAVAPRSARAVEAPQGIALRTVESPTSLEKLLGCSFAYAAEHAGKLRRRSVGLLSVESRTLGMLAHEALAEAARRGAFTHEEPHEVALEALDERLPALGALLLMPGHQQERMWLREAVARAATLLGRVVKADDLRVHAVEEELAVRLSDGDERTGDGARGEGGAPSSYGAPRAFSVRRAMLGTPDLVLEDASGRLVLLDFKWSGETYRRDQLRSGVALQLAAYAAMLREAAAPVRTLGYLILQTGRLFVRGEALAFAQQVRPELLDETWAAALRAWGERESQLSRGALFAEGIATPDRLPPGEALLQDGLLVVKAPCDFCPLDLLCGRARGGA